MYEDVISFAALRESANQCCKGVRWKTSAQMFEVDMARWLASLRNDLKNENYKPYGFTEFDIIERGKKRHILANHISERCVQKSLTCNELRPYIAPRLIYDNGASLKGKGTDFAIKRLKQHLAYHYKKHGREGGILLVDYSNYFDSIDHVKLKDMLKGIDEKSYRLLEMFIDAFDKGLGLGSEISQICAIYYPNKIDHYIKEHLHIKGYARYMDDSYLIHESITHLKKCKEVIAAMSRKLGLKLNKKMTRIIKLTDQFVYLKKRIMLTETGKIVIRLSRDNITHRRRIMKKLKRESAAQSFASWKGYAEKYMAYNTIHEIRSLI